MSAKKRQRTERREKLPQIFRSRSSFFFFDKKKVNLPRVALFFVHGWVHAFALTAAAPPPNNRSLGYSHVLSTTPHTVLGLRFPAVTAWARSRVKEQLEERVGIGAG